MNTRALLSLLLACGMALPAAADPIRITGSDTIVRLTQRLAEAYMISHPGTDIAVSGGGSGTGIAGVINATTDIADASRPMQPKELVRSGATAQVVIALDAIALVVHPSNPLSALSPAQIRGLFRGEIRNWKDIGGPDAPVTLYGRQNTSGTWYFFRDQMVQGEYAPGMAALQGNAEIMEMVQQDRSGIGYIGLAFARRDGVKTLHITLPDGRQVSPLAETDVLSGIYPLTRPLYQYLNLAGTPEAVRDFVRFELGPEGQALVAREGFLPVTDLFRKANARAGF